MLKYGLICEDIAQKLFLEKFLTNFKEYKFSENNIFYKRFRAQTKKDVLKAIPIIDYPAFEEYHLNLLFIGIDYDDLDRKNFKQELKNLYDKIHKNLRETTIIFYPVQAIEHWLLYLKFNKENPKLTKNISFEQKSRKDAKKEIYGNSKKVSEARTNTIISKLTTEFNITYLKNRSESFRYFYNDFLKFLENSKN